MVSWVKPLEERIYELSKESHTKLTPGVVPILEKLGSLLESETRERQSMQIRQRRANAKLWATSDVVQEKALEFRCALIHKQGSAIEKRALLRVHHNTETYLQYVIFRPFDDVPEMIILITRNYGHSRIGARHSLCTYRYCRGQLNGAVPQAANLMREHCT